MSTLPKLDCPNCLPDIFGHYEASRKIVENNQTQLEMALGHPQGSKLLAAGRVIVLRDGVSLFYYPVLYLLSLS